MRTGSNVYGACTHHQPHSAPQVKSMSDHWFKLQASNAARRRAPLPTMMSSHLGELSGNRPDSTNHPAITRPPQPANNGLRTTRSTDLRKFGGGRGREQSNADSNSSAARCTKTADTATEAPHRDMTARLSTTTAQQPSSRIHSKRSLPVTRFTSSTGPGIYIREYASSAAQSSVTSTNQVLCQAPFANPLQSEFAR